ncbi:MAG: hypothetical protein MZW92_24165 [Comamonadaceae bacterium]|nr:hypothetical protein [Comamonadaceae bacterium]
MDLTVRYTFPARRGPGARTRLPARLRRADPGGARARGLGAVAAGHRGAVVALAAAPIAPPPRPPGCARLESGSWRAPSSASSPPVACSRWPAPRSGRRRRPPTPRRAARPNPRSSASVSEDDNVRIEELKVRGQTQNITVHTKRAGVKPYEIVPQSGARGPLAGRRHDGPARLERAEVLTPP